MTPTQVKEIKEKVKEAVESDPDGKNISRIYLFGSFLHGDPKPDSDVDLLFESNKTFSLFQIVDIQDNLSRQLGRKVDLIPKDSLDKYIKDDVLSEAKKIYDNG